MFTGHPTITAQLVQDRVQDLHRINGATRLHREAIHRRHRLRRSP